jgi:Fe-S cluster biogenesis protein NfuA
MLDIQHGISEDLPETHADAGEEARVRKIHEAVDELRPHLQRDGGDCKIVSIEGNIVRVKMSGACVGCQLASVTIHGIQAKLITKLGMPLRVIPVLGGI